MRVVLIVYFVLLAAPSMAEDRVYPCQRESVGWLDQPSANRVLEQAIRQAFDTGNVGPMIRVDCDVLSPIRPKPPRSPNRAIEQELFCVLPARPGTDDINPARRWMRAAKDCSEGEYPEGGGRFEISLESVEGHYYVFECAVRDAHAINVRRRLADGRWSDATAFPEENDRAFLVFKSTDLPGRELAGGAEEGRLGYEFGGCYMHVFEEK